MRPITRGAPRFRSFGAGSSFRGRGVVTFAFDKHRVFVHRPFFPRHRVFLRTFPFGSPFLLGSPIYPYLTEYPAVYTSDPGAYQPSDDSESYDRLSSQLRELDSEVERLRDENQSLRSEVDRHKQSTPIRQNPEQEPGTVLVFRDGHRTETQSYAIVGQTVWILSSSRATKVPLSQLDLDQTIKVNEDRGTTFLAGKAQD